MAIKYFHISLGFKLKDRPSWLESFRSRYDKPYPYHLTLKNETSIQEEDISDLDVILRDLVSNFNPIELELIFDDIRVRETNKGFCIMVFARKDLEINDFQSKLQKRVNKFGEVTSLQHRAFENNFEPHITIARHLTKQQLLEAQEDLPRNISFCIIPEKLTLSVVKNSVIEQRLDEKNRTYYYF